MKKYTGWADGFAEMGSEGVHWALDTGKGVKAKDFGLIFIEPGDHLKIFGEDGSVVFDGEIVPDYNVGWRRFPKNRKYGQQQALGSWVHWIQKDWKPNDWAALFIGHALKKPIRRRRLRAELIKKPKKRIS